MSWRVRNNRRTRIVEDPQTKVRLRGTVTLTDEQMKKLEENPVIRAMLRPDDKGGYLGSELLTVTKIEEAKADNS